MTTETPTTSVLAAEDMPRDTVAWSIFDSELDCPAEVPGEPDDGPSCVHGPVGFDMLHVIDDHAGDRWWTNRYVILRQDALDQDEHLADLTALVTNLDRGVKSSRDNQQIAIVSRLAGTTTESLLTALAAVKAEDKATGPAESHFYVGSLAPLVAAGLDVDARPLIRTQLKSASPMAHVVWRGQEPVGLIMPVRNPDSPFHMNELRPPVRETFTRLRTYSHLPASLAWHYAAIAASPETGDPS